MRNKEPKLSREDAKLAKFNAKRDKADQKALARAASQIERESEIELRQEELDKVGREVFRAKIQNGARIVDIGIYANGYVGIGRNFEKLLGISGETQVLRKTGIGRSAATAATVLFTPFPGFNLLSPGQRGRISLVIVTDRTTHLFSTEQVHESAVQNYEGLLSAGKAIIKVSQSTTLMQNVPASSENDLGGQLKQISELHAQGILSDDEFAAAKAKLLS